MRAIAPARRSLVWGPALPPANASMEDYGVRGAPSERDGWVKQHIVTQSLVCLTLAFQPLSVAPAAAAVQSDVENFVIVSAAGRHGAATIWTNQGGDVVSHVRLSLRGMETELHGKICLGPNGQPVSIVISGRTPQGEVDERFDVVDGMARWTSMVDRGQVEYDGVSQYAPLASTWVDTKYWAESLHRAPGRRLSLIPGGAKTMSRLTEITVGEGATAKTVVAWKIDGVSVEPDVVLLDEDSRFFGVVGGDYGGTAGSLSLLPAEYADAAAAIAEAQSRALADENRALSERYARPSDAPVAVTDVTVFDAESGTFERDQTVVVRGSRIACVGTSPSCPVPAGANVIDGRNKTLLPGLWDSHLHASTDRQGLLLLSIGVTSARDPGAERRTTIARRQRLEQRELLFPTLYSSILVDGKGPMTAQVAEVVTSPQEAVAAVQSAKQAGYWGVKFYGSISRELLDSAISEAVRLGLHVHGHVPAGMRASDAIAAGYQEITHINFVMMEAMPESVVASSNGFERIAGPAKYAKDVDLSAKPIASLIAAMARSRIYVDPTLSAFEKVYVTARGEMQPSYAPYVGTLPAGTERRMRLGGFEPPVGTTRDEQRRSFAKFLELLKALHDAGVPIVAGTDGSGLEIVRELELYVAAGLSPHQALQTATIHPARLIGVDAMTGSVTAGKEADLFLVDGDPSVDIGALRNVVWVMSDGVMMDASALRKAAGFVVTAGTD